MFRRRQNKAGRGGQRAGAAAARPAPAGGAASAAPAAGKRAGGGMKLSFGDDNSDSDEDGAPREEFRIRRGKGRGVGAPLPLGGAATDAAGGSDYGPAAMAALRAAQKAAPGMAIKGSFKADAARGDGGDSDRIMAAGGRTLAGSAPPPPPPPPGAVEGDIVAMEDDGGDSDDSDGAPCVDAATIAQARAERAHQRATATTRDDYVPMPAHAHKMVADMAVDGAASSSDDDGDHDPRDSLALAAATQRAPSVRAALAARAGARSPPASDSEEERFEQEQLRRARVTAASAAGAAAPKAAASARAARSLGGGRALSSMDVDAVQRGAEGALDALRSDVARLGRRLEALEREGSDARRRHAQAAGASAQAAAALCTAGERFELAQAARAFVRDLCEMLHDKAPLVEEMEEALRVAAERRTDTLAERRANDEAESAAQVEAEATAALGTLGRGGDAAAARAAALQAGAAAVEAAAVVAAGGHAEPDEFGRDPTAMVRAQARRRLTARERRQEADETEAGGRSTIGGRSSGGSGSESDGGAREAFDATRHALLEAAQTALADAAPKFATLDAVAGFLERWRVAWAPSFRDAYVPQSAPQLLAPFVRLEMLAWEPLWGSEGAPEAFDAMAWYASLFEVGTAAPRDGTEGATRGGELDDLVPSLIELVGAPILEHCVRRCWCVGDAHQAERLADAVRELLVYVPAERPSAAAVLEAAMLRLKEACDACVKAPPPCLPAAVLAASPAARRRGARRARACVRTLRALAAFDGLYDGEALAALAGGVLARAVAPHVAALAGSGDARLAASAARRAARAAAAVEGQWFQGAQAGAEGRQALRVAEATARAQ